MKHAKLTSKNDLLVKIAKMYYKQNMTQQQIADELYLCRSNVSRLLKSCVEQGVVEFYINETSSNGHTIGETLVRTFGLKDAIVIPSCDNIDTAKQNLGTRVFMYLQHRINNTTSLGVSWGTTLYHVSLAFRPLSGISVPVIQIVGGQQSLSIDTDGSEIAKRIAKCVGGNAYIPHVPFFVGDPKLKEMLMCEPNVKEHFERARNVDIALVGVGSSSHNLNSAKRAGYVSSVDLDKLLGEGAVADICGIQLNEKGECCAIDHEQRRIGLNYDDISNIPFVLASCVGIDKAPAIYSALRSGLIDAIAIDEETATAVINLA